MEVFKMLDPYDALAKELENDFFEKHLKEEEYKIKKEMAKKCLLKNYPISDIVEIIGLDEETILKMAENK